MRTRLDSFYANSFYARHGKRWMDVGLSAALLVSLCPVLGAVAVIVRRKLGSPVLLRQQRTTMGGRPFSMLKFRSTMHAPDATDARRHDEQHLKRLSELLRETGIDQLPELWNVLRGDMSLVGPLPLVHEHSEHDSPEQQPRQLVRPGIVDCSALKGLREPSGTERVVLDQWYLDNIGIRLDLCILVHSLMRLVSRRGGASTLDSTTEQLGEAPTRSYTQPPFSMVRLRKSEITTTQAT